MIANEVISAGVCSACYVAAHSPKGPLAFTGAETRKFVYVFAGSGVARHDDLGLSKDFSAGSILDFRGASSSALTEVDINTEHVFWVSFFTQDKSHALDQELLGEGEHDLSLDASQESVFVLRGAIEANGKEVSERQFFKLKEGEKYAVSVPDNALAIRLKRTD